jgi:N-acetylglucosaminyldiphosphoundecaprenol N-acetyl-beta-D-mannosaminyltransferase
MTESTGPGRLERLELDGLRLAMLDEAGTVRHILSELAAGRGGLVVTPNLDHLRRFHSDPEYRRLAEDAELQVADGVPLLWAARLLGRPLPGRVAGADLISSLSAGAAEAGRSVFLLGGEPGTAEEAAGVLRKRHPGLKVAGTFYPPFGFERDPRLMGELTSLLERTRPDIVFVALGSPKQEKLAARLRPTLPGAWWLGVGISFSFLCGHVRRAPAAMQRLGLEWLHRMAMEPGRLARRYLVEGLPFAAGFFLRVLNEARRAKRVAQSAKRECGATA